MTEKELIKRCKKGSTKAQRLLYKSYQSTLLGICMRYAKSKDEAEDIFHMAMMKIYKNIGSYSGKGSFEGWLKQITVHLAIDNFRKNHKHYYLSDIDEMEENITTAQNIPDSLEVDDILKTIQQLPPGYRVVFNLYAIEGYSHKEIAQKLNISESTSKTQLLKARKKLKQMLVTANRLPEQQTSPNVNYKVKAVKEMDAFIPIDIISEI